MHIIFSITDFVQENFGGFACLWDAEFDQNIKLLYAWITQTSLSFP